jgi:hypothetical protein
MARQSPRSPPSGPDGAGPSQSPAASAQDKVIPERTPKSPRGVCGVVGSVLFWALLVLLTIAALPVTVPIGLVMWCRTGNVDSFKGTVYLSVLVYCFGVTFMSGYN